MTYQQIKEWIAHADREWDGDRLMGEWWMTFAEQVAAQEREACAKIADDFDPEQKMSNYGQIIASRIRARGET